MTLTRLLVMNLLILSLCACGVKRDLRLPDDDTRESSPSGVLPEKSMPDVETLKNPVYDPSLRR
ncbi:hypothetical protein GC177_07770 [bacterium]|nr:hypothetical protein [bacterium]